MSVWKLLVILIPAYLKIKYFKRDYQSDNIFYERKLIFSIQKIPLQ